MLRNSFYLMTTNLVTSGLGYVYWVGAARLYPPHDVGLAASLISAMTLVSLVCNLGLTSTIIHRLPQRAKGNPWSVSLNAYFAVGSITGLVGGGVMVAILPLISRQYRSLETDHLLGVVVLFLVPLWVLSTLMDYVFISERSAGHMLVRNSIFAALKIPLIIVGALLIGATTLTIQESWELACVVSLIPALIALRRFGHHYVLALRGALSEIRMALASMVGNHVTNLGAMLPSLMLPVFVTIRLSATQNAYFYSASMMGGLFLMISVSVAASVFAEGSHAREHLTRNIVRGAVVITVLLALVMPTYIIGGRQILGVFGPAYASQGYGLLVVFTIAAIPDAVTNIYVSAMRVLGKLWYCSALTILMGVITLALGWTLLPMMGVMGAGVAWLIAQCTGTIIVAMHLGLHLLRRRASAPLEAVAEPPEVSRGHSLNASPPR